MQYFLLFHGNSGVNTPQYYIVLSIVITETGCLLRGTNWSSEYFGLIFVFEGLIEIRDVL
jgi:hypothetical protein